MASKKKSSKNTNVGTSAIVRLTGSGSIEQVQQLADLMDKQTGIRPSASAIIRLAIQRLYEAQMKGKA